jgi:putative transposase
MRRHFSAKQKAQIVLEIFKEERTIAQIASEYNMHPNQLHRWKKQATDHFTELFQKDDKRLRAKEAAHERQLEELYAEIGRLTTQVNWLKKIWPRHSREMSA